ncbi:hypothetical protein Lepto7376_0260 [[Leptolyngbya] sp. PCC 7376]|uniref:hypothetical protein n=1 Tax=[Leptolyngbya] sp. PCC 7376 TaxID=111781 RepID=UPI00029EC89B|nr:hypothetical protein [[Leptolyngbya] sp. PCC 7376]AFY36704.1 hypothetical protein Lepto7376_0260 [[Leptolyngbya] sp. PCC 7376]
MTSDKIEIAQNYLGNLAEDNDLAQRVSAAKAKGDCLEVSLSQTDRGKGRIQATATTGISVGIIKSRDWSLRPDDVLLTESGDLLLVHLQEQKVMVLSFAESIENHAIKLVHLGHTLGNHHWPITIHDHKIYLQLVADESVVEKTIHDFHIPGLKIDYEWRSPQQSLHFSHHHH